MHGIQPNVSAYNSGVSPPPMEARSRKQVHGSKKQGKPSSETINLAVEKKIPGSSTNTCRSKKNIPTGSRKHTSKSPTFFVTLGPKKIWLGPKNMYRSKKRVPRSKKHASHIITPQSHQQPGTLGAFFYHSPGFPMSPSPKHRIPGKHRRWYPRSP